MDLRLLRTFVVAARLLNFHQAADRLYLAQPTVTAHIRQLEQELGAPLFERTGRRVKLTAMGERFLPMCQRILDTYEETIQDLNAWRQGYHSTLRILSSQMVAGTRLPEMLKRFAADYPHIEVKVSSLDSPEIPAALQDGRGDVGLMRMPPFGDFEYLQLYEDPVVLVAPRDEDREWQDLLTNRTLIIRNHPVYWDDLLLALDQKELVLRTMAVTHIHVTKRLIEEGLGVSFLPTSAVEREVQGGSMRIVPTPGLNLPVAGTYVVYPTRPPLPQAAAAFVDTLQQLYLGRQRKVMGK